MEGAKYKVRKNTAWKRVLCAACAVLTAGVMTLQTGFVSLAYPSSGTINDTGVNIRSTSDSSSSDNVMKKSETGMEVSVLGEETGSDGNTWLKVSYNDNGTERIGYIRSDYVDIAGDANGSDGQEVPADGTDGTDGTQAEETTSVTNGDKNPDGLTPIEGLDDGLSCYLDVDQAHFYINQSFTDDMIPDGFYRTEVDYRNNQIQVVKSYDIELYLVYLTNYDDQSTSDWYVYDAEAQGFSYCIKLQTMQGKYLYMLDTFGAGQMDFGYEETTLEIDGKKVQAWQLTLSAEEDLTGENHNFYYVFGINQDGDKGLYSYYAKDGTYQRNILTGLEIVDDQYLSTEENTKLLESQVKELKQKYTDDMSKRFTIICVLIVVCVLLLFVSIHMALKARRLSADVDEDEDDDDDEIAVSREEKKEKGRGRKLFGRKRDEDDEDEEDDDDILARTVSGQQNPAAAENTRKPAENAAYGQQSEAAAARGGYAQTETVVYGQPAAQADMDAAGVQQTAAESQDIDITPEDIEEFNNDRIPVTSFEETASHSYEDDEEEDDYDYEEDDEEEDEDDEEEVRPRRRGFFFGRHRDDEDDEDEDDEDEDEDDDEDDEEEVRPRRRGFFFGRRRDDDDEDDEDEDEEEDDEDDYDEDEDEDDDEDDEEEVRPRRRGFFFGRRRDDDDEDDEDDDEDDEDEEDEEDDEEEQKMSWSRSRQAARARERQTFREEKANKQSRAADYAEKTVAAKRSSRAPEPVYGADDDFDLEFIDLDDDDL